MIVLYTFIDEQKHQYLLHKYSKICNEEFNAKILKYRRWQDAQLSLLGRILLKYGLNQYFNIYDFEIDHISNHKPFIKNQEVHFNISHARNIVVCGISKSIIGVDIEYVDSKINYNDFKSQVTPNEFNKIHLSEDKVRRFFTYWTEKEAVIKAHGKGLLIPLQSFEIFQGQTLIDEEKFYLKKVFIHQEYKCCIASNTDIRYQNIQLEQLNLNLL
ncbi:4'-phosphopantetheinyl transferase family protein [Chryseobacterium potabilaquae]|uniref:4'-phosphopantetheinyl transferase sfp n=1 Tax=Chryseobacterium potabilaquae TaxID=2675057 RepID=A0A6N4XCP4_9FLAO|nr:4'-phosphopantetheinyl transferase superfamily protein [Chryseobacterium potabilaquae]CAA7196354.1 4'-phosphopantetheinyl transferase sfp [Chryseobacterium potabilaquae]